MDIVKDGSMELVAPGSPRQNNKDNPLKLIGSPKKIETNTIVISNRSPVETELKFKSWCA
jgi:hypothetical protein